MTKVFILIVAEVALLLLLPAALFAWLGRRSPYFAALGKRYNRLVNVLLVVLVAVLLVWPLLQTFWPR